MFEFALHVKSVKASDRFKVGVEEWDFTSKSHSGCRMEDESQGRKTISIKIRSHYGLPGK